MISLYKNTLSKWASTEVCRSVQKHTHEREGFQKTEKSGNWSEKEYRFSKSGTLYLASAISEDLVSIESMTDSLIAILPFSENFS